MAAKEMMISLDDVTFDNSGRAIISRSEIVDKLRGGGLAADGIKNIGCCSVALESGRIRPEDVSKLSVETVKALGPEQLSRFRSSEIKNIGCCSFTD